jgi:hypothetical protein
MIAEFLAGRNVEHWRRIHDGQATRFDGRRDHANEDAAEVLGSEALRTYLADHPCGGC